MLTLKFLEELEEFLVIISTLLIVIPLLFLLFCTHLYLLRKTFRIEINYGRFFRDIQNTPLLLLWTYFAFLVGMSLLTWLLHVAGYDKDQSLFELFQMNSVSIFLVVVTCFILWSLLKYGKKISVIASIGIGIISLIISLKHGFYSFFPFEISFPLMMAGSANCMIAITFLLILLFPKFWKQNIKK